MPDLGRHETEWAAESAWYHAIRYFSHYGGSLNYYIGEFSAKIEIDSPYCQIVCVRIEPASTEAGDSIEIATIEISIGVSKNSELTGFNPAVYRNVIMGGVRQLFFDSGLTGYLEAGMSSRGGITTTTIEPLKVYSPLYQTGNISYTDDNNEDYHIRTARVQSAMGPT
jgi:hypothetical protein